MSLLDPSVLTGGALVAGCSALVYVESGLLIGFFLPGDTVLFAAGLATASPAVAAPTWVLATCVALSAVAGDATGFALGRRWGRSRLEARVSRRFGAQQIARAEAIYERYGVFALVVARFIPWVRTFIPLLAGASRLGYLRFALGNVSGALCWGAGLVVLGRVSAAAPGVKTAAVAVAATVVALSFLGPAVLLGRRAWRGRGGRAAGSQPSHTGDR